MSGELNLRQEAIRLAFARSASVRLTPGSLTQLAVLLGRRAENEQDRHIAAALSAMPIEQVRGFLTEATAVGKRLRDIAPFEVLFSTDEMDIIASGIEDPIIQAGETYERRRIDDLVTGTVNASTTTSVSAGQIAAWIRDGNSGRSMPTICVRSQYRRPRNAPFADMVRSALLNAKQRCRFACNYITIVRSVRQCIVVKSQICCKFRFVDRLYVTPLFRLSER